MGKSYNITDEGIKEAIDILDRGGFLPEATEDQDMDTLLLKTACDKYVETSRAKGNKRTEQEKEDAMAVSFFVEHLSRRVRRMIN